MALVFSEIFEISSEAGNPAPKYVESLMLAHEPDSQLYQYYISEHRAADKSTLTNTPYAEREWSEPESSVTLQAVSRIGVKQFPHLGGIAFVNTLYDMHSYLLCPIHVRRQEYEPPVLSLVDSSAAVTFTISGDTEYECYRIIMRNGDDAFEYITYDKELTVNKPYIMGSYSCYCVGYMEEYSRVSKASNSVNFTVTAPGEDPLDKFEYYTKKDIDSIIGNINALLDQLNGEVI